MTWIVNNWSLVLILVLIIAGLISLVIGDKKRAQEWLLWAVTEAEKELGAKTGVLKLRLVYDWFVSQFPLLAKFISFQEFSDMVDEALERMDHYIRTNSAFFDYVGTVVVEKLPKKEKKDG